MATKQLLSGSQVKGIVLALAKQIAKKFGSLSGVALVGIHTNGVFLAQRLQRDLKELTNKTVPTGTLDITFYRDDIGLNEKLTAAKATEIPFDITGKHIVLVDDVLYTGRTIRAAMGQLLEYGRPRSITVAVVVDRGLRELPVYAEFVGKAVATTERQKVKMTLSEQGQGKEDQVILL